MTTAELLAAHAKGWAYCLSGAGARVKVLRATFRTTFVISVPVQLSDGPGRWLLKCVGIGWPDGKLPMNPDGKPEHP